jgi:DNA replication protein DnaC
MQQGYSLLLHGSNGVGKTWASCAIAKEALKFTANVIYISMPTLIQVYIDRPRFSDDFTWEQVLANWHLLVLDDLGKEYRGSGSGHSENRIQALIRDRVQKLKSTVISTNLSLDDIEQTYGESFASLVLEYEILHVPGYDLRRNK